MLQQVIAEAMSKGGDYADLFFEHTLSNSLGLEDGKVNSAYSNVDYGVGIRVLKGDQTGFAYTETTSLKDMLKVAKTAANIANDPVTFNQSELIEKSSPNYYNVSQKWENSTVEQKIPFVQKVNDRLYELDDKVTKARVFQRDESSYVMFYTVPVPSGRVLNSSATTWWKNLPRKPSKRPTSSLAQANPKPVNCRWCWVPADRGSCFTKPWGIPSKPTSTGKANPFSPIRWEKV
jgi:hypothetical protein